MLRQVLQRSPLPEKKMLYSLSFCLCEMRYACNVLFGTLKGNRPFEKRRLKGEDNITRGFRALAAMLCSELHYNGSGHSQQKAGFCEHSNGRSVFTKRRNFLTGLSAYNKDLAP
jgi:hypothetical protein